MPMWFQRKLSGGCELISLPTVLLMPFLLELFQTHMVFYLFQEILEQQSARLHGLHPLLPFLVRPNFASSSFIFLKTRIVAPLELKTRGGHKNVPAVHCHVCPSFIRIGLPPYCRLPIWNQADGWTIYLSFGPAAAVPNSICPTLRVNVVRAWVAGIKLTTKQDSLSLSLCVCAHTRLPVSRKRKLVKSLRFDNVKCSRHRVKAKVQYCSLFKDTG